MPWVEEREGACQSEVVLDVRCHGAVPHVGPYADAEKGAGGKGNHAHAIGCSLGEHVLRRPDRGQSAMCSVWRLPLVRSILAPRVVGR
jgi:hypothetical protein